MGRVLSLVRIPCLLLLFRCYCFVPSLPNRLFHPRALEGMMKSSLSDRDRISEGIIRIQQATLHPSNRTRFASFDQQISSRNEPRFRLMEYERAAIGNIRQMTSFDELNSGMVRQCILKMHPGVAAAALRKLVQLDEFKGKNCITAADSMFLQPIYDKLLNESPLLSPKSATFAFISLHRDPLRRDTNSWPLRSNLWQSLSLSEGLALRQVPTGYLARLLDEASTQQDSGTFFSDTHLYEALCRRVGRGDVIDTLSVTNVRRLLCKLQHPALLRTILKRLRKQSFRNSTSITSLVAILQECPRLMDILGHNTTSTAVYTLAKHVYAPHNNPTTGVLSLGQSKKVLSCLKRCIDISDERLPDFLHDYYEQTKDTPGSLEQFVEAAVHWRDRSERTRARVKEFCATENLGRSRPVDVTAVLRLVGLLFSNETTMVKMAFSQTERHCKTLQFLEDCRHRELANIAWFMATKVRKDCSLFDRTIKLAKRVIRQWLHLSKMLGEEKTSPKLTSRFVASVTGLFPDPDASMILSTLFRSSEGVLLSASDELHPNDISAMMTAHAKRPRSCNVTIFCSLASSLAAPDQLQRCTTRQAAQALWACGRLSTREDFKVVSQSVPTKRYLRHLVQNLEALSPLDVSQSIWGLARLDVQSEDTLLLTKHARTLSTQLRETEVANILWGMSKLRLADFQTVFVLTRRYCDTGKGALVSIKPEEASSILYALGCMDIHDEEIYRVLTDAFLRKAKSTNAQAVTNMIWAYRNVHMEPPLTLIREGYKLKQASAENS